MKKSQIQLLKRAGAAAEKATKEENDQRLADVEDDFQSLDNALHDRETLLERLADTDKEIQQLAGKFNLIWSDGKLTPKHAKLGSKGEMIPVPKPGQVRVTSHVRKRPRKAAGRRAGAGQRAAKTVAANKQPLATHVLRYMAENPGSHSATEIAAAVKKAGYQTHAKNFRGVIQQCMHHSNLFRRFGRDMWGLSSVGAVAKRDLD